MSKIQEYIYDNDTLDITGRSLQKKVSKRADNTYKPYFKANSSDKKYGIVPFKQKNTAESDDESVNISPFDELRALLKG